MSPKGVAKMTKQYKIMHDLVPANLSGLSAYRLLGNRAIWRKRIRIDTLSRCNQRCVACATTDRPQCNEVWVYRDEDRVAELIGFEILCADCHWAAHIGLATVRGFYEEALAQFCRVNGLTRKKAEIMVAKLIAIRNRRSKISWKLVVATRLLREYPDLKILEREVS